MDETQYLCKDCKHCVMDTFGWITTLGGRLGVADWMFKCSRIGQPAHVVVNPVIGYEKIKERLSYCSIARSIGDCGPTAKYWTPKHKKDLFKALTKERNV